jgi:hypothetical protein
MAPALLGCGDLTATNTLSYLLLVNERGESILRITFGFETLSSVLLELDPALFTKYQTRMKWFEIDKHSILFATS